MMLYNTHTFQCFYGAMATRHTSNVEIPGSTPGGSNSMFFFVIELADADNRH